MSSVRREEEDRREKRGIINVAGRDRRTDRQNEIKRKLKEMREKRKD